MGTNRNNNCDHRCEPSLMHTGWVRTTSAQRCNLYLCSLKLKWLDKFSEKLYEDAGSGSNGAAQGSDCA